MGLDVAEAMSYLHNEGGVRGQAAVPILPFLDLPLYSHCLSVTVHCLSVTFHCLIAAFL